MANTDKVAWITSLDPIKILQVYNEDDYENIIEEWQRDYLGKKYARVERLGGSGDKGRDIICTDSANDTHIYQCKHYDKKLGKQTILTEIAKCCYYCFNGDYKTPKKFYFVSPQGVTVQARDLLINPTKLKAELKAKWKNSCILKIRSKEIKLAGSLETFIDNFDFSIFDYVNPPDFLEEFKQTPNYTRWFGKLVKPRKIVTEVPPEIRANELTYIKKILDAYSDYLGKNVEDAKNLKQNYPELWRDLTRQRTYFYSAEYLAAYSRDTYPSEMQCFERLKDEVYHGIIDEVQADAKNGFQRLRNVLKKADGLITCSGNPLNSEVNIKDRRGICHHLANEREEICWKK